jgi:hypothetical protein
MVFGERVYGLCRRRGGSRSRDHASGDDRYLIEGVRW